MTLSAELLPVFTIGSRRAGSINKLCEPNGERGAQSYNGLTGVWGEATSGVQGQSRGTLRP